MQSLRLACSLDSFYRNFLADEAPFSFDRFQRENIQDHDVDVTRWQQPEEGPTEPSGVQISVRTLSFTHPIRKTSMGMGPKEARTRRRQILKRYGDYGITIENNINVEGIPSADCFSVHDFWKIAADGTDHIVVSVRFAPRFTKRTFLRGMIEKNIKKESKAWFVEYTKMVHAALEDGAVIDESEKGGIVAGRGTMVADEAGLFVQTWLRSVYPLVLLGVVLVLCVLAILILQLMQARDAMSVMREEMVALRQANHHFQQEMVSLRRDNQQTLQLLLSQQQQISSSLTFVGENVAVKSRGEAWDPDDKILTFDDSHLRLLQEQRGEINKNDETERLSSGLQ